MNALLRAGRKVEEFYMGPIPVHHVVVLRIGFGLIMLFQYLLLAPYFEQIFGADGLVAHVRKPHWVLEWSWTLWTIQIIAAFCFIIGFFSRTMGLITVFIHNLFHAQTTGFAWGDGAMGHTFIVYTCLSRPGARFAVDTWIRRRIFRRNEPPVETVRAWPIRLLQLHVCTVYFTAAWNRIHAQGWLRGRMTFVALSHSLFSRFPTVDWIPFKAPLWLATWYTLLLEAFAPVQLWRKASRTAWAIGLILLHLGLELTSTITWWQFYMMTALTVFLPSRWICALVERLERVVSRRPPVVDPAHVD